MQRFPGNPFEFDVFICHSSKDKTIISILIEDFKKENITYWIDADQIDFGDSITEKINEGLEASNYIIPCISKNLRASGWTKAEYGSILNREFSGNSKRKVIPLILENCDVNDIPPLLSDKKRVTYSDKTEFKEFIHFLKKNHLNEANTNSQQYSTGGSDSQLKYLEISKTFISPSIGMEFILIPNGKFTMGSPSEEQGRYDNEGPVNEYPVHEVNIKKSFYMGKYPVTQKQWRRVMGNKSSVLQEDNLPIVNVSWDDAQEFIRKLNQMEVINKYRLPSEAEWEYACRADTKCSYSFGDDESILEDYAWYNGRSRREKHIVFNLENIIRPVGEKKPNPWGLYDMYGNVYEWCQDNYHENYNGAPSDGRAWEDVISLKRVFRGGSYCSSASYCRSAFRSTDNQNKRDYNIGFRVVREI